MDELRRFLTVVGNGEVWEPTGERWQLEAPHPQAIVTPNGCGGYVWSVRLLPSDQIVSGPAVSDHEAMRAAERVIEEHRPPSP